MNCDQHQQIIGVCLNCKSNFCEQCLSKHIKHYNRIILTQNLLYLCYEANIQCIDLYEEIVEFLNSQIALQSNFIDAALKEQIVPQQIEFYFSIIEKKYFRFFIIEIIKDQSKFNPKKKNKIIKHSIDVINEDYLKYLMIKNSDLHCLLLKLGLYLEAKWLFDHDIKKLLKNQFSLIIINMN